MQPLRGNRTDRRRVRRLFVAALLVGAVPGGLLAQDAGGREVEAAAEATRSSEAVVPPPEAVEAISRLKSPYCPGFMLEVCPSQQAKELRDTIEVLARSGMDAEGIVEWVLDRHGEEWRALPRTEGKGLIAWLGPPLALLLGTGVVVGVLLRIRKRRGPEGAGDGAAPELSEDAERRLEEAVREFDGV